MKKLILLAMVLGLFMFVGWGRAIAEDDVEERYKLFNEKYRHMPPSPPIQANEQEREQERLKIEQEQREKEALKEKLEKEILKILLQKSDKWLEIRRNELQERKYSKLAGGREDLLPLSFQEEIELEQIYYEIGRRKEKAKEQREREARKKREDRIKTFSPEIQRDIKERKIRMGMTKEQVLLSWGNPNKVNRSVGGWGVHEQWCYHSSVYLYFENDVLTSWQD